MIKRIEELNNFKRGDKNIGAIYRGQTLIWPTTPLFVTEYFNGYVGGNFTSYGGTTYNRIIKLNKNTGAIDSGFNIGTGFSSRVLNINKTPDDKLMISGLFLAYNGTTKRFLTKLNTFGTIDSSFTGEFLNAVSMSGERYVVSSVDPVNGDTYMLVRGSDNWSGTSVTGGYGNIKVDTNGLRDNSYIDSIDNIQTTYQFYQRRIRYSPIDNKLYVPAALLTSSAFIGLAVFNSNGTIQTIISSSIVGIPIDLEFVNGRIYIAHQENSRFIKCLLISNYSEDPNFNQGTGFNAVARSVRISPVNFKLVIGGDFTSYNGVSMNRIAMINLNGSLETSFNIGTGFNNSVRRVMMSDDGKIVVAGSFTEYNGTPVGNIVKLNLDGSLDTSFNSLTFNGVIDDLG